MRAATPRVLVAVALGALLLQGCGAWRAVRAGDAEPPPPMPAIAAEAPVRGGGVFAPDRPWLLLSDSRAYRAGDVLTVVLQETTQATKSADTSFSKESGVSVAPGTVGGRALRTDVELQADRNFSGSATSTQQNALQGAITVVVQEVLPNGLLRIAGEKTLTLNQGEEFIRLGGYVRPSDIDTDNRVSSQRVANARIAYSGRGALKDANSPGWLTRFFASPWLPF